MESKLKVVLLSHTPEPEETIAAAARLCYQSAGIDTITTGLSREAAGAFIEKLVAMDHTSPIEHASFIFAIEGISRACSHQLVRHRLASYSQQSQRYVSKVSGFDYVIPPSIGDDEDLRGEFETIMASIQKYYSHLVAKLNGKGLKGEGAHEDARFVLPNAAETKIIVTMNARELLHFFRQRCCNRAQWEIRAMAIEMLKLVRKRAPAVFAEAGPPCLKGSCPEGRYSCRKAKDVKLFFRSLFN